MHRARPSLLTLLLPLLFGCSLTPFARAAGPASHDWPPPQAQAVEHWKDLRFGMFIHWGPVSLTGKEIGWSRGTKDVPIEEYDSLYKRFDPQQFNADEWVAVARSAGMKYIILTTKHHDGFCLWDTKYSDYNIMKTPFRRDVVKELSEACKRQAMPFGVYYSVTDWYDPRWPLASPGGKVKRAAYDLDAYEKYLQNQVGELITHYGPLLTIWNDMPAMYGKRGADTIRLVRKLQPDIIVNDRTGDGGDYATPEQRVAAYNTTRPCESCMTLSAHNHWAWGGDADGVKDLRTCIQMLVRVAGGDGNMLLNVGPRPDGQIDREQRDRLAQMGQWTGKYGESIYATRGGPFKPADDWVSTHRGNVVYVHVLKWTGDSVRLPAVDAKVIRSELLTGGRAQVTREPSGITIHVSAADRQEFDTIVKLEFDAVPSP